MFLADPDVLRTGEANQFVVKTLGRNSMFTLDGQAHAQQRRELLPPFHGEDLLRGKARLLRALTHAEVEGWRAKRPVRLEDACREIALQAILRVVLGLTPGEELERLAALVRRAMHLLAHPMAFLAPVVPAWLEGVTMWGEVERLQAAIDAELFRLIATRRASRVDRPDVLGRLLQMHHADGASLSDRDMRDQLYTLLLAGHDTTAIALSWALVEILRAPEVLTRVQSELEAVVGDEPLEYEHLPRLEYLDAAIKESLRLRPLVDYCVRRVAKEFTADGVTYPVGLTLAPCQLLAHFNPAVWPQPHAFRPERFLATRPDPYAWIPFGGGRRRCLGMNFALLELRVVLATILRRVRFQPATTKAPRMQRRGLFLAPSDRATFTPSEIRPRVARCEAVV